MRGLLLYPRGVKTPRRDGTDGHVQQRRDGAGHTGTTQSACATRSLAGTRDQQWEFLPNNFVFVRIIPFPAGA